MMKNYTPVYVYPLTKNDGWRKLTRIDLADEDDKRYGLDRWCKLFKAETWEDMRMIAEKHLLLS